MTTETLLPNDLESEEALLGSLLLDPARFADVESIVSADDFYREIHAAIWAVMRSQFDGAEGFDQLSVSRAMLAVQPDFPVRSYAAGLIAKTPTSVHVVHYARAVKTAALQRQAVLDAQAIADAAHGGKDPQSLGELFAQASAEMRPSRQSASLLPLKEHVDEAFNELQAIWEGGVENIGLKTRIGPVDRILGGLLDGKLYVIGARPGMGKTQTLVQIAYNVAGDGHRVAFFSLEETSRDLISRMMSIRMGTDWKTMPPEARAMRDRDFQEAVDYCSALDIFMPNASQLSAAAMRAQTALLEARDRGAEVAIVDYLQLADVRASRNQSREQIVAQISRELKAMAMELEIPVLVASQLNRGVEDRPMKEPMLRDLRESGSLEQDADAVLFLYRPVYYVDGGSLTLEQIRRHWNRPDLTPKELAVSLQIHIAKNRQGPTRKVEAYYDPARGRITGIER